MKILLLEDDSIIATQIKTYFELFDYTIDLYENGLKLLEEANPNNYDIMLLDINTPGISGLDLLKEFRSISVTTPAIFVTAMSSIDTLKEAYKIGCNDYVRKPFDIEELELRIKQLVLKNQKNIFKINSNYTFNLEDEKLYHNGREVYLNEKERNFIYLLAKNYPNSVSKESIKNYLWGEEDVCNNTLRTKVKKLRDKLEDNFIVSLRGIGYKLDAN